jgi:hypothetical protein
MKKMLTVSTVLLATSLLLTGCSNTPEPDPNAPLVSTAQGLGDEKVDESVFNNSQFEKAYDSTDGKISFEKLDLMEWQVQRVLKAPKGENLPEGDNFQATAANNFSYYDTMKEWIEELKADGWVAKNEVKSDPRSDEAQYTGTKEDYRTKLYSVDLSKGKSSMKVKMENETITLTMNSQ